MPFKYKRTKKAIGANIKQEMKEGKPRKQAIAIALNIFKRGKKKTKKGRK